MLNNHPFHEPLFQKKAQHINLDNFKEIFVLFNFLYLNLHKLIYQILFFRLTLIFINSLYLFKSQLIFIKIYCFFHPSIFLLVMLIIAHQNMLFYPSKGLVFIILICFFLLIYIFFYFSYIFICVCVCFFFLYM